MTPPNSVAEPTRRVDSATSHFHLFSFLLGLVVALVLVGGTLFLVRRPDPPPITLHPPPTPRPTSTPLPTPTDAPITVYVSGAVRIPGLYELPITARVGDALAIAGGLNEAADAIAINQAERLWDGAQVHIPPKTDEALSSPAGDSHTRNVYAAPPPGVSGAQSTQTPTQSDLVIKPGGLININAAPPEQLESLPGIGPSKAAAIIANRPFANVEDLERVPGIGAKTVELLRDLVVFQ